MTAPHLRVVPAAPDADLRRAVVNGLRDAAVAIESRGEVRLAAECRVAAKWLAGARPEPPEIAPLPLWLEPAPLRLWLETIAFVLFLAGSVAALIVWG